jgi:hypothetical protein
MVESIYCLKPAWCGIHFAGFWPEQGLQPVTRATALRRWFVTLYCANSPEPSEFGIVVRVTGTGHVYMFPVDRAFGIRIGSRCPANPPRAISHADTGNVSMNRREEPKREKLIPDLLCFPL